MEIFLLFWPIIINYMQPKQEDGKGEVNEWRVENREDGKVRM
jgi:hypothetical protein